MAKQRSSLKETIGLLLEVSRATESNVSEEVKSFLSSYCYLPIDKLSPGKFQPRKVFNEQALQELSHSIQQEGILQPLIVRALSEDCYEIIAGERRWRAASRIGLEKVPVIIREVSDESALAFGILENLQRQELNVIEEAESFRRLIEEFSLTHQDVSKRVCKSRAYISNSIRLLKLPEYVQNALLNGEMQMGHAKVIMALEGDKLQKVCQKIIAEKLSVRQAEVAIRKISQVYEKVEIEESAAQKVLILLEKRLSDKFKMPCKIKMASRGMVKLEISFRNLYELERRVLEDEKMVE